MHNICDKSIFFSTKMDFFRRHDFSHKNTLVKNLNIIKTYFILICFELSFRVRVVLGVALGLGQWKIYWFSKVKSIRIYKLKSKSQKNVWTWCSRTYLGQFSQFSESVTCTQEFLGASHLYKKVTQASYLGSKWIMTQEIFICPGREGG